MANISFDWRSWRSITTAAVVAVLMAACGGDKESGGSTSAVAVESTSVIAAADAVDTSGTDSDYSVVLDGPSLAGVLKVRGAKVGVAAVPDATLRVHYQRADKTYGDYASATSSDFWGLHVWGDVTVNANWDTPYKKSGEDSFGVYFDVPLTKATGTANYIIHKGNTKEYDGPNDAANQSFNYDGSVKEIWRIEGDTTVYTVLPIPANTLRIHYKRTAKDYGDYTSSASADFWGLHAWGDVTTDGYSWDVPFKSAGEDAFGVFFDLPLTKASGTANYIIHKGNDKEYDGPNDAANQKYDFDGSVKEIWRVQGDTGTYTTNPDAPPVSDLDYVRIHYKRFNADYSAWGLHLFGDVDMSKMPTYANQAVTETNWSNPLPLVSPADGVKTGTDTFGVYIDVPVKKPTAGGKTLKFIVHGLIGDAQNTKDGGDHVVTMSVGQEVWMVEGGEPVYSLEEANKITFSLNDAKAFWVSKDLILWPRVESSGSYKLYSSNRYFDISSDTGAVTAKGVVSKLALTVVDAATLSDELKAKYAYVPTPYQVLKVTGSDEDIKRALRTQLAVVKEDAGKVVNATGVQTAGALDSLYAAAAKDEVLGAVIADGKTTFKLWAPTALQASVAIYDNGVTGGATAVKAMTLNADTGVWSVVDAADLSGKYYKFIVDVHVRGVGLVRNKVTDPYSVSLSTNSKRSYIADLNSAATKPDGWDVARPAIVAPSDMSIYQLHVRDFSIADTAVAAANRGKFAAFADAGSQGMAHLKMLKAAGLTNVQLLPVYDFGSVNEETCATPAITQPADAASEDPSNKTETAKNTDCFNWGYDPVHYGTLEGSYSTDPADGLKRIKEFRSLVLALHTAGLHVTTDNVYNHTFTSGQAKMSIMDRIVPGYYQRLTTSGAVSTGYGVSLDNTASENAMFEKLMIDTAIRFAVDYKVDAFRFDWMSDHSVGTMKRLRAAVIAAIKAKEGNDVGADNFYVYGEGWGSGASERFGGDVDPDGRKEAGQRFVAGTGLGVFNDRIRDGVRGIGPFDGGSSLMTNQGYVNGRWYDANEVSTATDGDKSYLVGRLDLIRSGMTGAIKDFMYPNTTDGKADLVSGNDLFAGYHAYTNDPQETVNYVSVHDRQTIFDANAYLLPQTTTMADRIRVQMLSLGIVAMSQGTPFFHGGDDILRSKSFDSDSYNSGDWYNQIFWDYSKNNFGIGVSYKEKNENEWSTMTPILRNTLVKPAHDDMVQSRDLFLQMLKLRYSSPLLRLKSGADVKARFKFYNADNEVGFDPTFIVQRIADDCNGCADLDPNAKSVVVVINVDKVAKDYTNADFSGKTYNLNSVQTDPVVTASAGFDGTKFHVPARSIAVFVEPQ